MAHTWLSNGTSFTPRTLEAMFWRHRGYTRAMTAEVMECNPKTVSNYYKMACEVMDCTIRELDQYLARGGEFHDSTKFG